MTPKPTLGQILGMAGGLLLFIFGFLDWYTASGESQSGWGMPVANWAPLLGILTAIFFAVAVFAKPPQLQKLTIKPATLLFSIGLVLTLDTFGYLVADPFGIPGTHAGIGVGLILSFICALVMLAGGVLDVLGIDPIAGSGTAAGGYPPQAYSQPAGYPQPGYGPPPGAYPQPGQAPPPPSAYPPPAAPPTAPTPNPGPPAGTETQVVPPNPNPGPPPVPGQGF